jgi:hypothetical protein
VVDVTDRADVAVRLVAVELFLGHQVTFAEYGVVVFVSEIWSG